jgi:hypothetical protein
MARACCEADQLENCAAWQGRHALLPTKRASSATKSSGRTRTREQLYKQATRLKIEGRSSMNKDQLERAVERAKKR